MDLWHTLFFSSWILRMNQRQSCLSDYSRIFADIWPLANGSRPICAAVVFCHADFADDADFSSLDYFVPQISQIYTDFFHRKVFHRISRMNRKAFLLIGLLTDFRGYLAAGQWLAPDMCCYCFWSRRFRRWRRFFFVGLFCPTDFTDLHRFFSSEGFSSDFTDESEGILAYRITHGFSRIFGRWPMAGARYVLLLFLVTQISQMTQIFLRGIILSHRFHRYTQIFLNLRRIAWASNLRINSVSSDE